MRVGKSRSLAIVTGAFGAASLVMVGYHAAEHNDQLAIGYACVFCICVFSAWVNWE